MLILKVETNQKNGLLSNYQNLAQRRTASPKFIWAISVFLCLGHTKSNENQKDSELQGLTGELQDFVSSFEELVLYRFEEHIARQLMFDYNLIENQIYK